MNKQRVHAFLLCVFTALTAGCSSIRHQVQTGLPYESWYIGFLAPAYMDVWLETADVEDVQGRLFFGAMSGTVSIGFHGDAAGWGPIAGGKGRNLSYLALPRRIYVRWQSLVEPQTYGVILEIPESARRLMLTQVQSTVPPYHMQYRHILAIGLAPGGWVQVWVMSPGAPPIPVLCQKAEIEPKGPSQGLNDGHYAYKLSELEPATQQYLKTHTIPYDSWKCSEGTTPP